MKQPFDWIEMLKINLLGLKVVGAWPNGDESYKKNLYYLWAIFCLFFIILLGNIFPIIYVVLVFGDMEALLSNLFVVISQLVAMSKGFFFMKNMQTLKDLLMQLRTTACFQPQNEKQILLVSPAIKLWKLFYYSIFGVSVVTLFFMSWYPLWDNSGEKFILPHGAWYPFNTNRSGVYQLIYMHQVLNFYCCGIMAVHTDALIAAFNVYVAAQFDLLCDNIQNLNFASKNAYQTLEKCIQHHKAILGFMETVNKVFEGVIVIQFSSSAISIGVTMFQMTNVPPISSQFMELLTFLNSIIMQIFQYCWFGNEVTIKSSKLPTVIFTTNWFDGPLPLQKNLFFFLERSQKPVYISAMKLFQLSLDTFLKILKTSWSYFCLLTQVSS